MTVYLKEPATGKDISDHLGAGKRLKDLVDLASAPSDGPAAPDDQPPLYVSLAQLLANPDMLTLPSPLVPRVVWEGRLTLLSAREKVGKSTFMAAAVAVVTQGEPFLGDTGLRPLVLWVTVEEHLHDLVQRAQRFATDPERLFIMAYPANPAADWLRALEELRTAYPDAPLVTVVDTLLKFSGIPDENDAAKWDAWFAGITPALRRLNVGAVFLHHATKAEGRYRGSTAIGANVDVILEITDVPESSAVRERHFETKGRWHVPDFTVRLEDDVFVLVTEATALSLDAQILAYVRTHPACSFNDICEETGHRRPSVRGTIDRLLRANQLRNTGTKRAHAYVIADPSATDAAAPPRGAP